MRRPSLWLVPLLAAALAAGCKAPQPYAPDEERPRVGYEARWWEQQGDRELARAWATESLAMREKHFAWAISDLRHARDLYYGELETLETAATHDKPVPAGRREALDVEIERLSAEIDQLVKERPIDPPPPLNIGTRLLPK